MVIPSESGLIVGAFFIDKEMVELKNLERFEMPIIGVYFLFKKDKLIYIGESISIFRRIYSHIKNKDFDSYSFIKCDSKVDIVELEKKLIIKYRPILNIKHKTKSLNENIETYEGFIKKLNDQKDLYGII